MYEWHRQIQTVVDEIDRCIRNRDDEALTLRALSAKLGYSEYHMTRKFRQLSGMMLRDYLRLRRLAFALIAVRDSNDSLLAVAVDYGFSSHEAFTRAFRRTYGMTPQSYRKNPTPVVLRTKSNTFDRYILGIGEIGMMKSDGAVKIYYVSIPAHKFLHIKNYESDGYFDFWEKQETVPDGDCDTICGLLDSIKGKLDGEDGVIGQFSGQIMARLYEADGKMPEAYGVRLPADYTGIIPAQMRMVDVPEASYIVFEHGPFDYDQENLTVAERLMKAVDAFRFDGTDYAFDNVPGRVSYYYHDPEHFCKYVMPVRKAETK